MTKAVLYARVSTEDQAADDKTSLSEQLLALRKYAGAKGFQIVDEIPEDKTGRKRHTPGMDRMRDLAEANGIDVILVYKWNRLARTVGRFEMFMAEMKVAGVDVIALDGQSNNTAHGRMFNHMMAVFSQFQRDDLIATTKQGKLGRARAGRVVPGRYAPWGYSYDPAAGTYAVDAAVMPHVQRVFRMLGTDGTSLRAVKMAFDREGVKPPGGGRFWRAGTVRRIIQNDVYRPHGFDELKPLLSPDVAARLDPNKKYGIAWYNRSRWERNMDPGPEDEAVHVTANRREDWIAVPIPDAGIPRKQVDAARERVKNNVRPSKAAARDWELKGSLYCPCGSRLSPRTVKKYRYYTCTRYTREGKAACKHGKNWPAEALEQDVRSFVLSQLRNSGEYANQIKTWLESERKALRPSTREAVALQRHIDELERKRAGYLDLAAEGYMSKDELGPKLAEVEKQKEEARRGLDAAQNRQQRLDEAEDLIVILYDQNLWLSWVERTEDDPDRYKKLLEKLRLRVVRPRDGPMEIVW